MKRSTWFVIAALLFMFSVSTWTSSAFADPGARRGQTAARIAKLKEEGDAALAAGRHLEALQNYDAALAIADDPVLHRQRGRALERLGRSADAVRAYETFLAEASPEVAATVPHLISQLVELRKKTTVLRIAVKPDGTRVTLAGVWVGTSPIEKALRVDAGRAEIEVTHRNGAREARTILLPAGEEVLASFVLVRTEKPRPVAVAPAIEAQPAHEQAEDRPSILARWWFWTGVGVVVTAGVATTLILTDQRAEARGDIEPGRITAPLLRF